MVLERSGEEFFGRLGLSGIIFGATVLAAATSLPEVSTGLTSTRLGDYQLAISDIFGGNAFLPVLFLLATVLSGKPVLPDAYNTDIYLTALGVVLTIVYMAGLIFRPRRQYLRWASKASPCWSSMRSGSPVLPPLPASGPGPDGRDRRPGQGRHAGHQR